MKPIPSPSPRGRRAAIALAAALAAPAALAAVDTRIDGLPAGLSVTLVALEPRCTANGMQNISVAQQPLAEQTTTVWDTVPLPGGGLQLVQRTRTAYVGRLALPQTLPASGCSFGNVLTFNLGVLGQSASGPAMRFGQVGTALSPATLTTLNVTMAARTTTLVNIADGSTPAALVRGQTQRWSSSHRDSMNESSVVEPALDFLVQTNFPFFGAMASRGRISITRDGQVCVRSATGTVCRTRAQGGTVVNGDIEADVADTRHTTLTDSADTTWRFRLGAGFPAGAVVVRVSADDLDPFDYLVDGVPTPLNLLPWASLSLPLLVN